MIPLNQSAQRNVTRVSNVARLSFSGRFLHQALDFFGFSCAVAGPKNACIFSTSPRWHDKDQDPGQPTERNLSLEDVAE